MRNKAKQKKEETLTRIGHKWSGKLAIESAPLKEADKLAFIVIDRMRNPHGVSMRKDSNGTPFVRVVDSLGIRSHSPEHDKEEVRGAIALALVQCGHFETDGARVNFPELFTVARKALCMTSTQEEDAETKGQREDASPWSLFSAFANGKTKALLAEYKALIEAHYKVNSSRKAKAKRLANRAILAGLAKLGRGVGFADIPAFCDLTEQRVRMADGAKGAWLWEVKTRETLHVMAFRFLEDCQKGKKAILESLAISKADKEAALRFDAVEERSAKSEHEEDTLAFCVCQ